MQVSPTFIFLFIYFLIYFCTHAEHVLSPASSTHSRITRTPDITRHNIVKDITRIKILCWRRLSVCLSGCKLTLWWECDGCFLSMLSVLLALLARVYTDSRERVRATNTGVKMLMTRCWWVWRHTALTPVLSRRKQQTMANILKHSVRLLGHLLETQTIHDICECKRSSDHTTKRSAISSEIKQQK